MVKRDHSAHEKCTSICQSFPTGKLNTEANRIYSILDYLNIASFPTSETGILYSSRFLSCWTAFSAICWSHCPGSSLLQCFIWLLLFVSIFPCFRIMMIFASYFSPMHWGFIFSLFMFELVLKRCMARIRLKGIHGREVEIIKSLG